MRRSILLAALLQVACDGCGHSPPAATTDVPARPSVTRAPSAAPRGSAPAAPSASADPGPLLPAKELTWVYDTTPTGPIQVVISLPVRRESQRFPVLVALHGRGEAFKGPARGARGWIDDYWLPKAIERLHEPPLTKKDFLDIVDEARLAKLNASLEKEPYHGLIVVCPYTPDVLAGDKPFSAVTPFATWLVEELLPRVKRETPAIGKPEATGIDGVSLGGRVSLLTGLERPEAFGDVATLQAAFDSEDAPELTRRARAATTRNPKLELRLLTSDGDFFLRATRTISKAWTDAGIAHQFVEIPGPHDYPFNRGPGAYEMLLFHDRVLRGEPPPIPQP
ncbi:MAG: esterase [Myxococcales bacterium]|nr:esterase [Myxococcales bacterium]MCB9583073.1 esterase [Polyangiaceae bacterium]